MVITTLLLLGLEKLKYSFTARRIPLTCPATDTHPPFELIPNPQSCSFAYCTCPTKPHGCRVMAEWLWWLCLCVYSETEDHIHCKSEHFRDGGAGNSDLRGIRRSNSHHQLELRWVCLHWRRAGKLIKAIWMTVEAKYLNLRYWRARVLQAFFWELMNPTWCKVYWYYLYPSCTVYIQYYMHKPLSRC